MQFMQNVRSVMACFRKGAAPTGATRGFEQESGNVAAATLAWSFREYFKYRGAPDAHSARDDLGWYVAGALAVAARQSKDQQSFLEAPLACKPAIARDCPSLLKEIDDPILTALWELGTLRALSDMLAHIPLREVDPGHLSWNTADYALKLGVNLREVNGQYLASLSARAREAGD